MSLLRAFALSCSCALLLVACEAPPAPQQPPPATTAPAVQEPAAPNPSDAVAQEHYLKALELEAAGRYVEAKIEVDQALDAGAGRDARILAAKLAILRNDLDAADNLLSKLAGDTNDALVQYNVGLVAQRRNQYNRARSAYLAAAKADPALTAARFNLAILTWDAGVRDEAQHHARKFLEMAPGDPRAAELRAKVELDAGPAAPGVTINPGPANPTTPASTDPSGLKNPFDKKGDKKTDKKTDKKAATDDTGLKDPFAKDPR